MFDYRISIGSIHNLVYSHAELAKEINEKQDLSSIKIDLKDEIFQGNQPVLTGIDNFSTYCYLLTLVKHRDEDTWGYYLLNLREKQGLNPERTIADAAKQCFYFYRENPFYLNLCHFANNLSQEKGSLYKNRFISRQRT